MKSSAFANQEISKIKRETIQNFPDPKMKSTSWFIVCLTLPKPKSNTSKRQSLIDSKNVL